MSGKIYGAKADKLAMDIAYKAAFNAAHKAGVAAAAGVVPVPMVVSEHANPLKDGSAVVRSWHVPGGVCGFAWVEVHPANKPFAKWLKANKLARPGYPKGLNISVHEYGQSLAKKEAHAMAMAAALKASFPDMDIYGASRMD